LREAQPRPLKGLSGQLTCRDTFPVIHILGTTHTLRADCLVFPSFHRNFEPSCNYAYDAYTYCLRTIVLAEPYSSFPVEAVGPESGKLNIALTQVGVGNQEPGTKDTLGQDVEDGVGNNLAVNANPASTVGKTPDAAWSLE
jgi:hypothetical protein